MGDKYVVVTSNQDIYFFEGPALFDFLNETRQADGDEWDNQEDREENRNNFTVLESFPIPNAPSSYISTSTDDDDDDDDPDSGWGRDGDGRSMGEYCPFREQRWPPGAVFILNVTAGKMFVPERRETTKVVKTFEYGPPAAKPAARKPAAKKAAAKKARKR